MIKFAVLVFAAAFAPAIECVAQASPAQPRGALLTCGVDSLEVHIARPEGRQRTGLIVDACRITGASDESRLIERVYRTTDAVLGNRVDTIVDRWSTLSPISYRSRSARETVRLTWIAGRIKGEVAPAGQQAVEVNVVAAAGVYNGASFDLVLRASPLKVGHSVSVPAYVPGVGNRTLTAKVVGEEIVTGVASWRVDADYSGMAVSFWISKDTRRLVKQMMQVAPGTTIEFIKASAR